MKYREKNPKTNQHSLNSVLPKFKALLFIKHNGNTNKEL